MSRLIYTDNGIKILSDILQEDQNNIENEKQTNFSRSYFQPRQIKGSQQAEKSNRIARKMVYQTLLHSSLPQIKQDFSKPNNYLEQSNISYDQAEKDQQWFIDDDIHLKNSACALSRHHEKSVRLNDGNMIQYKNLYVDKSLLNITQKLQNPRLVESQKSKVYNNMNKYLSFQDNQKNDIKQIQVKIQRVQEEKNEKLTSVKADKYLKELKNQAVLLESTTSDIQKEKYRIRKRIFEQFFKKNKAALLNKKKNGEQKNNK